MKRVKEAFRPQPQDVIGVLLGLLVLGAYFAPRATAWVCGVVIVAWAVLGLGNIVVCLVAGRSSR